MKMKEFIKIGLFVAAASLFFSACANKTVQKTKVEKPKVKTIENILADSFIYDENQKLYKNSFAKVADVTKFSSTFNNFCAEKKGKIVKTDYYINDEYAKSFSNNQGTACEIDGTPYFITNQITESSKTHYSISIDEQIKKDYVEYKNNKQLETTKMNNEIAENLMKERLEIQKREIAREKKTKLLFSKNKNQRTMTFFDSWRDLSNKTSCSKKCYDLNLKNNGFKTIQEATSNNWEIISKVGDIEDSINSSCTCIGYSVEMKKVTTN